MVAFADVGDDGHFAFVAAQSFPQDPAARTFQDRHVHRRIHENCTGTLGPRTVSHFDAALADVDAVGARHADTLAGHSRQVGDQTRGGRLAVHPGDRGDRNSSAIVLRVEQVNDRFAHRA